jgi:hypothetical protein
MVSRRLSTTFLIWQVRGAEKVFRLAAAAAELKMREFNPQELANTAWAYATSGHSAPELFDAVAAVRTAGIFT